MEDMVITVDGVEQEDKMIELTDDGKDHHVYIIGIGRNKVGFKEPVSMHV